MLEALRCENTCAEDRLEKMLLVGGSEIIETVSGKIFIFICLFFSFQVSLRVSRNIKNSGKAEGEKQSKAG